MKKFFVMLALAWGTVGAFAQNEADSVAAVNNAVTLAKEVYPQKEEDGDLYHGLTRKLTFDRMIPPYGLEVTYGKTTHIIFPSSVRYVDLGSPNLIAGKADGAENVIRVKTTVKDFREETNMSVITESGSFYTFNVKYAEEPLLLNIEMKDFIHDGSEVNRPNNALDIYLKELGCESPKLVHLISKSIHKDNRRHIKHIGSKAFGIQYTDKDNKLQYCHETSWGVSTRLIGAIIMVHGDDSGLVLPPKIAPTQVMVIPIQQQKDGVLDKAYDLKDKLSKDFRVKIDATDKTPGWKFAAQEVQGISTRIEIGPKDIEKNQCVIVRRDTREKIVVSLDEVNEKLAEVLETMQNDMLEKAKAFLASHINDAHDYNEFKAIAETKPGFIRAMWCGDEACENKIKEDTTVTSRCMPFGDQEQISDVCVCCGKPAHKLVYWGKAY